MCFVDIVLTERPGRNVLTVSSSFLNTAFTYLLPYCIFFVKFKHLGQTVKYIKATKGFHVDVNNNTTSQKLEDLILRPNLNLDASDL